VFLGQATSNSTRKVEAGEQEEGPLQEDGADEECDWQMENGKWETDKRASQVNPSKRRGEQQFIVAKWRRRNTIKCNYKGHKDPDPPQHFRQPAHFFPPPTGRVIKWKWKILPAGPLQNNTRTC